MVLENRLHILQELNELAPALADVGFDTPYRVPEHYFENLPSLVLDQVSELNMVIPSSHPFQAPVGYFEGLTDKIWNRLVEEESQLAEADLLAENETIAPILNSIDKQMLYTIPQGYFENFSATLKIPETKLVSFYRMRRWMNYAAAAIMAGILVTSAFLFTDKRQNDEFEKYRQVDISTALDQVSEAELSNYIENNELVGADDWLLNENQSIPSVNENIKSLSTEKLDQYLKDNKYLEPIDLSDSLK